MTDGNEDLTARPSLAGAIPDATLEEINRLWTIVRAFSNTAHDVNNALQVIAGSAELLESRELEPVVRRRVETIRTEAARAATTINRLLSYARAQPASPQTIDLWPIVEAAVAMRLASTNRNRVVLAVERPDPKPCWANVDTTLTTQALLDLLLAAEDAAANHRNARITVGLAEHENTIRVRVTASADDEIAATGNLHDAAATALTAGAQVWAAGSLAATQGGGVTAERAPRGWVLTMSVPAAPGRRG